LNPVRAARHAVHTNRASRRQVVKHTASA
jgi:hypothetical protein